MRMEKPRKTGLFRSRPVSRILSRVTISLCGVPGSSAGHVNGACFALHRTGFGEPAMSPRPLVGSYPTVSPLPASVALGRRSPFCSTFRRLSPPGPLQRRPASCPAVSGLSSSRRRRSARGHPACATDGSSNSGDSQPSASSGEDRAALGAGERAARRAGRTPRTRGTRGSRRERAPRAPGRACG